MSDKELDGWAWRTLKSIRYQSDPVAIDVLVRQFRNAYQEGLNEAAAWVETTKLRGEAKGTINLLEWGKKIRGLPEGAE